MFVEAISGKGSGSNPSHHRQKNGQSPGGALGQKLTKKDGGQNKKMKTGDGKGKKGKKGKGQGKPSPAKGGKKGTKGAWRGGSKGGLETGRGKY